MTGAELYNIIKKNKGMGGAKPRAYCGMKGGAWCCAYVCYGFNQGGAKNLWYGGKKVTYCPTAITWCRANLAEIPLYLAMPCDVIFFDWQPNGTPDHIGFVKNRISTTSIETHEGNTSGGIVAEKTRKVGARCKMWVFRPHFAPTGLKEKKLAEDGDFGYNTIYMTQVFLKKKGYYKGSLDGILGKATVKSMQAWAGVAQDGSWQKKTSVAIQKKISAKSDGEFGKNSVLAYQKYLNEQLFPNQSSPSGSATTTKPTASYSGTFPTLPPKTAKNAVDIAYAYGTKLSVYKYHGGKPKGTYKKALEKVYPDRKKWGAKSKVGASCDVFVGTTLRLSGYSKTPRGLSDQKTWLPKNLTAVSSLKNGDVLYRSNHVAIYVELKGGKYVANAHHEKHDGAYGIIEKLCKYTKAYRPKGDSYFSKGDTFTEVKNLQKFLNWYGGYKLAEDYIFGSATENAVKDFQKKEGLSVTGKFGATELAKAKAVKK